MSAISSVSKYSAAANNSEESISSINVCLTASDTSTRISPSLSTLTKSQTINLPSIGKDSSMSAISAGCKLASKRSSLLIFCLFTKFLMGKTSTKVAIIDKSGKIKLQVGTKTDLSLMILEHIFKIYSKEKENELIN